VRLREFKERQRLDEIIQAIPWLIGILGGGAFLGSQALDPKKIDKWIKSNPEEANKFADSLEKNYGPSIKDFKPDVKNPQSITNPIGNAITQSWNWLTGGSTQKDNVKKQYVPQPGDYDTKDGLLVNKNKNDIGSKVTFDQYTQGSTTAKKLPSSTINNIRSSGDAGAGWVKQYDDLYKKRSQINKQIAADIKNGLTKQQLDAKYGDNLQNLNRNLNDHLGKVDDFGKGLKPFKDRTVKPLTVKPLDIKNIDDDKISINGKTYDKDFDKAEIDRIIKDQKRKQQGQLSSVGTADGVSGPKDKGSAGATIGGGGMDIGIKGSGAVSGDKEKSIGSTDKPGDWAGGQEWDLPKSKGDTGVGTGTGTGTATGTGAEVIPGSVSQGSTIAKDIATTLNPANQLVKTMPPFVPPIVVPDIKNVTYRKYDPTTDKDIIYKGRKAPKNVAKIDYQKTGPGSGWLDKLRAK
jgi:hypothetical protein